jgi:spore coat polysaccharide biosynthesis predicted glycosyltransferase SpsG
MSPDIIQTKLEIIEDLKVKQINLELIVSQMQEQFNEVRKQQQAYQEFMMSAPLKMQNSSLKQSKFNGNSQGRPPLVMK